MCERIAPQCSHTFLASSSANVSCGTDASSLIPCSTRAVVNAGAPSGCCWRRASHSSRAMIARPRACCRFARIASRLSVTLLHNPSSTNSTFYNPQLLVCCLFACLSICLFVCLFVCGFVLSVRSIEIKGSMYTCSKVAQGFVET
jgi:hypothetical protein